MMQFKLKGRIDHTEFYNGNHMHVITTPAPDAYSQPSSFKVRGPVQLGPVGQEIETHVQLSGFVRRKPYKDKQTGQDKVYWEDNVFLEVIQVAAVQNVKAS
jgi:hypothetical protein